MLPENLSTTGGAIDQMFYVILWITVAVFVLVQASLLVFVIAFRQRPGRTAAYIHGSTPAEIVWTIIPALIFIGLGLSSQRLWAQIKQPAPADAIKVEVTGEQFAWNVRYAGLDRQLHTPDDVLTLNQLHIPVHQPVAVNLTSKDVIHSFFLPYHRVKQDVVPGLTTQVWFEPTQTGEYEIVCAELCGLGHYRMRGFMTVHERTAWRRWLIEHTPNLLPPAESPETTP